MARPDPDQFRTAMSLVPAAVTVVSAEGGDGPAGATASAVASLSLEPPLMLVCLDRGSRTLLAVQTANRFGINVLGDDQEDVARTFATKAPVAEKWSEAATTTRDGIPALERSLVWVACELHDVIAAGDHVIVTGEVTDLEAGEGRPLVTHQGAYRGLG